MSGPGVVPPQGREVSRGVALAGPALVFLEGDVEEPVDVGRHAPVLAGSPGVRLSTARRYADVVVCDTRKAAAEARSEPVSGPKGGIQMRLPCRPLTNTRLRLT